VQTIVKFEQQGVGAVMMKPSWAFVQIPKGLEWGCRNKAKTTIPGEFLAFLETINRG
jgi:hypothetical protein